MTEIAFHFNAPGKIDHSCRLLRKALRSGARVVVVAPDELLGTLDRALWTFSAREFLPHCLAGADADMRELSPIVLGGTPEQWPHHDVLLNLGETVPPGFERFSRLIEVVSTDEQDRVPARTRWRHYASRGYAITRHDLAPSA